jgi:hypothetical protein
MMALAFNVARADGSHALVSGFTRIAQWLHIDLLS